MRSEGVPFDRVVLERMTAFAETHIPDREVLRAIEVSSMVDHACQSTVLSMRATLYVENGPEYEHTITLSVPATWWDHLKSDLVKRWPRLKIVYKTKRVPYTFWIKPSAWYPSLSEKDGPKYKAIPKLRPVRVQGPWTPEITR